MGVASIATDATLIVLQLKQISVLEDIKTILQGGKVKNGGNDVIQDYLDWYSEIGNNKTGGVANLTINNTINTTDPKTVVSHLDNLNNQAIKNFSIQAPQIWA